MCMCVNREACVRERAYILILIRKGSSPANIRRRCAACAKARRLPHPTRTAARTACGRGALLADEALRLASRPSELLILLVPQ